MTSDADYMARALAVAERGRGTTSPNPIVGALIVDDEGVVVGRGAHLVAGGPHAEVLALADAGERARGATLYCTLEPCSHTGRTGPCAPKVVAAGIRRAVIAMGDPNPLVSGRGIELLRSRGIEVTVGILEADARRQNAPFLTRIGRGRPHVTMKVALSADGKVALAGGHSTRLTGDVANRRIHRDRAEVDAIAIGSGTLLNDDPLLTARIAYRRRPFVRVIFDRRRRTPPAARVLSTLESGPVIIVTGNADASSSPGAADRLDQGRRECRGHLARRRAVRGRRPPSSRATRRVFCHSGGRPHDSACVLGPRPRGSRPDVRRSACRLAPTAWDGGRRLTRLWQSWKTFDGPGSEPTC